MESRCISPLVASPQPHHSFLDLPAEVLVRVYEFFYEEIAIHCAQRRPRNLSSMYTNHVSPGLGFLLTARKIYQEAKLFLDTAPITVTGDSGGQANPRNFPAHVLQRIRSLSHPEPDYFSLSPSKTIFGLVFLDRSSCPNLRLIWKLPSLYRPVRVSPNSGFLACIRLLLEQVRFGHELASRGYLPEHFDLLESFKQGTRDRPGRNINREDVEKTDAIIKERNLTLKCFYKFFISAGTPLAHLSELGVDCEWFEVVVVWDKDGLRIEGFPDLKSKPWWRKYCDREFPCNDVPLSAKRVEFQCCETTYQPQT